MLHDLSGTQHSQHQEPDDHDRSERIPNDLCSCTLKKKKHGYNENDKRECIDVFIQVTQSLNSRRNGYGRSEHSIRKQGSTTNDCRNYQPLCSFANKCVKCKYSSLAFIIST